MLGRVLICFVICCALVGCKPPANPGTWGQSQVEAHLTKKHNLVEISLLPGAKGVFTGSGKTKLGETYMFKVQQTPEQQKLSWEYTSDRGDTGSEVYEFVKPD